MQFYSSRSGGGTLGNEDVSRADTMAARSVAPTPTPTPVVAPAPKTQPTMITPLSPLYHAPTPAPAPAPSMYPTMYPTTVAPAPQTNPVVSQVPVPAPVMAPAPPPPVLPPAPVLAPTPAPAPVPQPVPQPAPAPVPQPVVNAPGQTSSADIINAVRAAMGSTSTPALVTSTATATPVSQPVGPAPVSPFAAQNYYNTHGYYAPGLGG
jgi:hypothetical protein